MSSSLLLLIIISGIVGWAVLTVFVRLFGYLELSWKGSMATSALVVAAIECMMFLHGSTS